MVSVVRIWGQSLQRPHFSVVLCDFFNADLLSTTKFLIHLGRLYATIGFDGNIPDVLVSFCKIGKCFFRIEGTAAKTGCHSHTNIICWSFFASSFVLSWSSEDRSILDTILHHPAQEFDIISPFDEERTESITVGMIVLYIRTNSANPDELTLRYVVGNMFRMT